MAKKKRDTGQEILRGIPEIKRGTRGRVVNVASPSRSKKRRGGR